MEFLSSMFENGRAVDLILCVMLLEAVGLIVWRRLRGSGLSAAEVAIMLVPGACILLALRASLTGAGWQVIAFWLMVSFAAHLADVWRRWPR